MTLDQTKANELEQKINAINTVNPHPDVPKHFYARADMREHEGKMCPTFTRVRTKTFQIPVAQLDMTVDNMCNGTEEPWILKEVMQVQRRPGKFDGATLLVIFLCVDEIVLPTLDPEPEAIDPIIAAEVTDIEQRAQDWAQNTTK